MSTSQISASTQSYDRAPQLQAALGRFVRRSWILTTANITLICMSSWVGFILLAMGIDALADMSADSRWYLSRGSVVLAVFSAIGFSLAWLRKASTGKMALRIDASQGTGGEIASAWDLTRDASHHQSSLTAHFARQAIARSADALSSIKPAAVLPMDLLKKSAIALLAILLLIMLLAAMAPSFCWNQFKRFASPSSDTPPFTGLIITLESPNYSLKYGDDVKILAKVSRKPLERMELVTIGREGKERVLPMLPRAESKWQALLTQVTEPSEFYIRSGRSRSEMGKLEVQFTPEITETLVRITPPEYTHQAVYEGKIPEAGIAGLAGTQVEFFITSNRPLSTGAISMEFEDKSSKQIELSPVADESGNRNSVHGQLLISRDAKFEIHVTDIDQLRSRNSVVGKLILLTDQRPVVRIVEPRPVSLATPDINMGIAISAEDDFGITQLRLYRSLNGSPTSFVDLEVDGSARVNAFHTLPLPIYGLSPGDEIELFARTEDNDPKGPKGAESPKTIIRIISIAEFQERMLEQRGAEAMTAKYEAAQRHLENVSNAMKEMQEAADRAAADPSNAALQEELQRKLEALQKAAEQAAHEIDRLAENPMDIDIDQELVEMLREMAEETRQNANKIGEIADKQSGDRPLTPDEQQALEEMLEQIQDMRDEIQEEAIDPLNELSKTLPLMEDRERFDELVERQKELAQRMQSLADTAPDDPTNERRMMEMEAAQDEIRQELNELAERMEANADELPQTEEFSQLAQAAKELAQGMKQSGAPEFMQDAQKSLLKTKFSQAAENAKAAAEALEALMPANNSMGQQAEENANDAFDPGKNGKKEKNGKGKSGRGKGKGKGKGLGNTLEQLKQRMGRKGGKGQPGGEAGESPGGKNNGYSQRSSSPQNMGMYGSMPSPAPSSRGRSDKVSQGAATRSEISRQNTGKGGINDSQSSDASGQTEQTVPTQYKQRVSEYFRRINEALTPTNP